MEKTYRVTGGRRVRGTDPGGTFTADLLPHEEAALIQGGHIQVVRQMEPTARGQRAKQKE